jgi:hypothetical protein
MSLRFPTDLNDVQSLRTGKYPTKKPVPETTNPKILLIDLRPHEQFRKSHIKNAISFPAENI